MYPAVPIYNLSKIHRAIEHDFPSVPIGLRATWKEILNLGRKFLADPDIHFMPEFPKHGQSSIDALGTM